MYVKRQLKRAFQRAMKDFPAVLVTGARQSGKTTFVTHETQQPHHFVTFDDPFQRQFAKEDPQGFLNQFQGKTAILDEIQYAPEILSYIKMRVDQNRHEFGQWVLTGSQQFSLMRRVRESLAGRIAVLDLFPFSILEWRTNVLHEIVWRGLYPDPAMGRDRDLWLRSYIATYLQRDVRDIVEVQDMHLFTTFLSLCAARHAQELNLARISSECGISQPTAKRWLHVLQASYVIALIPPFQRNLGKRLVKSPKLYFIDPGIVSYLTRQPSSEAAISGAMGGPLFEGLIVSEAIKIASFHSQPCDLSFWRSHDGLEVDLILSFGGRSIPVEIKLSASPTPRHGSTLTRFQKLAQSDTGIVVCQVENMTQLPQNNMALPWQEFSTWLQELLSKSRRRTTDGLE